MCNGRHSVTHGVKPHKEDTESEYRLTYAFYLALLYYHVYDKAYEHKKPRIVTHLKGHYLRSNRSTYIGSKRYVYSLPECHKPCGDKAYHHYKGCAAALYCHRNYAACHYSKEGVVRSVPYDLSKLGAR